MVENACILSNVKIAKDTFQMELKTGIAQVAKPGQFIEITVPGFFLRRPISISEIKEESIVIVYKILGAGTEKMSKMQEGELLDIFGPLGNGFPIEENESVLLIGGGVGVPPLYELAKQYLLKGVDVKVVLGFNDASQCFYEEEFKKLGCSIKVATMDGSYGTKGTVLDAIRENNISEDVIYACGPLPMLRALDQNYEKGYLSLEARMACGVGACMGCIVLGKDGKSYRVCKDGPVFPIGKVVIA